MATKAKETTITIEPLNEATAHVRIVGTAPLMMHAFWKKAELEMRHREGGKSKSKKDARDFEAEAEQAKHKSSDGWVGFPASAFRAALISACRLAGVKMTQAKLGIHVEADGIDAIDFSPLVKLYSEEEPQTPIMAVRNADLSVDLRCRPVWSPGKWSFNLRVRFDKSFISANGLINLLSRAGKQVGIGEGRPDSKKSGGLGYGLFTIDTITIEE
jgi:hypothetical protein